MMTTPEESTAVRLAAELEQPLRAVEDCLVDLGQALTCQDTRAVDEVSARLHLALAAAVDHFGEAARHGGVPAPLRHRLALASGKVAAQREALARATASLDRAMDVLMPPRATPSAGLYGALGNAERNGSSGSLLA